MYMIPPEFLLRMFWSALLLFAELRARAIFFQEVTVSVYHPYLTQFCTVFHDFNTIAFASEVCSRMHPQMWEDYIMYTIYGNMHDFTYNTFYSRKREVKIQIFQQMSLQYDTQLHVAFENEYVPWLWYTTYPQMLGPFQHPIGSCDWQFELTCVCIYIPGYIWQIIITPRRLMVV